MRSNLIRARKKMRFSQVQLAKEIGISTRMYGYLEKGESDSSVKVWIKLSEILGQPIDSLIVNTEEDK